MDNQERLMEALADRYRIERQIGSGGMATVYLARDLKHDRDVAVKVLDAELAQNLGAERFLREIKTAAKLTHPHILPVHDSGEAGGFLFYVMPYIEGDSLRARLTAEKQLPVEDSVQITREVADALAYAHQAGVIHRDVKPANIMFEAGHAVLADFGVAQALAQAKDERITKTGMALGTPAYMSPEQAAGGQGLDGRSDQYALGCVLYEMLSGEPPFTGPTPAAVLARQIRGRLPSLAIVRPNVPNGLVEALEKSLAKVPADRYPSTSEFLAAVVRGATGDVVAFRPRGRWGPGRFLAAAGLVLAVLIPAYALLSLGNRPTPSTGGPLRIIAVTYFDAPGGDPALESFAEALTTYVTDALGEIGALVVISQNAMKPLQGLALPTSDIETLGIDAYVEGAVMGSPDHVRVSVRLIDAKGLSQIESEVVRGSLGAPFPIFDELAGEVSGLLRRWLGIRTELVKLRAGTESEAAWTLFQQAARQREGAIVLRSSGDTVAAGRAFAEADRLLARAEEEDPSYLAAMLDRGWLAAERAQLRTSQARYDPHWTQVGIGHAERVLEREPDNAAALELRGVLLDYLASETGDEAVARSLLDRAETDLKRAVDSDEDRPRALARLSRIYENQGRLAEAKLAAQRAYEADPFQMEAPDVLFRICSASLDLQEWTGVSNWCGEGTKRFPEHASFASAELTALAGPAGPVADPDRAWFLAERVLRLSDPDVRGRRQPPAWLAVTAVLARAGLPDSAMALLDRTLSLPEAVGPGVHAMEANARLQLGDEDGALDALERLFDASPLERAKAPNDWWWEEIWDHPRFQALVEKSAPGAPAG